jgi:hypothetical protein
MKSVETMGNIMENTMKGTGAVVNATNRALFIVWRKVVTMRENMRAAHPLSLLPT